MVLTFVLGGLNVTARYTHPVRGRRSGHPDTWTEGEDEDIEILSVAGDTSGEFTERDLRDAVCDEARRVCDDAQDACFAMEEESDAYLQAQ